MYTVPMPSNVAWSAVVKPYKSFRKIRMWTQDAIVARTPDLIDLIGGNSGTVKERLFRAHLRTGIAFNRLKRLRYGEAVPKAVEWANLNAFCERVETRMKRIGDEIHELDRECAELRRQANSNRLRTHGGKRRPQDSSED